MTEDKVQNNEHSNPTFKEMFRACCSVPNIIKSCVVLACLGVVGTQISTCITKLIDRPITTYTHFDFNKTIMYPSVTFCREPPYKFEKLLEYNLFGHPRLTSAWTDYNFSTPLDELWNDITYDSSEFFAQYGLDGYMENVEVTATIGFINGRCYTLTPKCASSRATKQTGFSVTLQHSADDVASSISLYPPGYHVFIHYHKEPYTEVTVSNGGLVEYLYSNVGETIDVKLSVDSYDMISSAEDPCNKQDLYSANKCTTHCVWNTAAAEAGCSGPWMNETGYPHCSNYTSMRTLISSYMDLHQHHECSCQRFCQSFLYNGYVNDRHSHFWESSSDQWKSESTDALQTQLYIYFNSMMVSVYEERYNYDWNLFISDLGGSVGFLLGLSVISILTILEKTWTTIIKSCPRENKSEPDVNTAPEIKENKTVNQGCLTCNKNNIPKKNYTN